MKKKLQVIFLTILLVHEHALRCKMHNNDEKCYSLSLIHEKRSFSIRKYETALKLLQRKTIVWAMKDQLNTGYLVRVGELCKGSPIAIEVSLSNST